MDELFEKSRIAAWNEIFEMMSVSYDVDNEAYELKMKILGDFRTQPLMYDDEENVHQKIHTFSCLLWGETYRIAYNIYTDQDPEQDIYWGSTNVAKKTMALTMCMHNGRTCPNKFDGIIEHELLHVFQYNQNKKDYLADEEMMELYNGALRVMETTKPDSPFHRFAKAMYISFEFEQDASAHGLYGTLKGRDMKDMRQEFRKSDEYKLLEDLKYSIDNIDLYSPSLFNMPVKRYKSRIGYAYKRYQRKLSNVYMRAVGDAEMSGLYQ